MVGEARPGLLKLRFLWSYFRLAWPMFFFLPGYDYDRVSVRKWKEIFQLLPFKFHYSLQFTRKKKVETLIRCTLIGLQTKHVFLQYKADPLNCDIFSWWWSLLRNKVTLDQIFFCDPVVLESICYHTRAKRLINESNTTEGLRKIWTGSRSGSHVYSVIFRSFLVLETCKAPNVGQLLSFREWTLRTRPNFYQPSSRIFLVYQSFCSRTIADRL